MPGDQGNVTAGTIRQAVQSLMGDPAERQAMWPAAGS